MSWLTPAGTQESEEEGHQEVKSKSTQTRKKLSTDSDLNID